MAMLSVGQKVTIVFRDATGEVEEAGWTVQNYDDGLVKLHRPAVKYREGSDPKGRVRTLPARTKVVNMRSHLFLHAEVVP
jgi:hypothetical protein